MFTLGLPRITVNVKISDMHPTDLLLQDVVGYNLFALQFSIPF